MKIYTTLYGERQFIELTILLCCRRCICIYVLGAAMFIFFIVVVAAAVCCWCCACVYIYISFSSLYTRQRHSVKTQHSVSDMHIRFRGIFDIICVCTQSSNKFLLWHLLLVLPTQRHKAFQTRQRAFCFDSKVYLNLQCFALNCMFFPIERFCQLILSYDFDSFMHIEHQKRWHNWNTLTLVYCFWMNAIVSNVVVIAYLHAGNW